MLQKNVFQLSVSGLYNFINAEEVDSLVKFSL